jgi:hypothetical protein
VESYTNIVLGNLTKTQTTNHHHPQTKSIIGGGKGQSNNDKRGVFPKVTFRSNWQRNIFHPEEQEFHRHLYGLPIKNCCFVINP